MQKTKRTIILSFLLCITMTLSAQRNEIFSSDIATLQVHNTQQLRAMLPVIQLNSGEQIQISFDNFRHEYHRFTYKIMHCEADWSPSTQLFSSDYLEGFSDNLVIDDI
ncbi:MAG: type IX secretion system plug protein domain-containing protein, partial [Segatella sp.]